MTLFPVIQAVASAAPGRNPANVAEARRAARMALMRSAEACGAPASGWEKDDQGAPTPNGGYYWSLSHKRRWAAAVISRQPVGIDLERVVARRDSLFPAVADEAEWNVLGDRAWLGFYEMWTAKEAVLKAHGLGIGYLRDCRLLGRASASRMRLACRGQEWTIEHHWFDDHVAAVTCGEDPVTWCVEGAPGTGA